MSQKLERPWYAMRAFTVQGLGLQIHNKWVTDALSEVLSTFILALFVYASGTRALVTGDVGSLHGNALAGGVGLTLAVYMGMKASGGSANPNVTLMFCLLGKVEWKRYPVYAIAEFIGAFLAAALTYGVYGDLLNAYDGGIRSIDGANATAQLFTSFPHPSISKTTGFFDIVVGTGLLTGSIAAIVDPNNAGPTSGLIPVVFCFMLYGIVMTFGANTGAAINTAIDLSGRLFAWIIYGRGVFSHSNYWFWIPPLAGLVGATLASFIYQLMVGNHLPGGVQDNSSAGSITLEVNTTKNNEKSVDLMSYKSSLSVISDQTTLTNLDS